MTRVLRLFLAAAALALLPSLALAQSCPPFSFGAVLTAGQWQACFDAKQNALGYTPVNRAGDTMTGGPLVMVPSSTTVAGFRVPAGTAPTIPVDGDMWTTTAGIFVRINGVTVGPLTGPVAGSFAGTSPIVVTFPAGVVTYAFDFTVANTFLAQQTNQGATTTSPGWYAQIAGDTVPRVRVGLNSTDVASLGLGPGNAARDLFLERAGAASLRLGAPDAASPIAQTIGVQNVVAGTSNTAGANLTIAGSRGTGTGNGGDIQFQVALPGLTGTAQNSLVNLLKFSSATGALLWNADNTYDIGASGATRPRDLFLGRNAVFGGSITAVGGSLTALAILALRDTSAAFDLTLVATSSTALTTGRNLIFDVVNGSRTLKIGSNLTIASDPGTVTGVLKSNGTGTFAAAACADLSNGATGCSTTVGTMATQNASAVAITGGTVAGLTGFGIRDTSAAFDVTIAAVSSAALTAGRTLTLNMQNVAHTLTLGTTASTGSGIIFPNTATDTVGMLAVANAWTGNETHGGTELFTGALFSFGSNGQASIGASATAGGVVGGKGSSKDLTLANSAGASVCDVATGTTTINCATLTLTNQLAGSQVATPGDASVSPSATFGVVKCDGTTIQCTSGIITAVGAAATSIDAGGATSISNGTNGDVLVQTAGKLAEATIASLLTGGAGVVITGTTNATISSVEPVFQHRITLTSATPVLTSTVSAATTVYVTPYNGTYTTLYDGTNLVPTSTPELSIALGSNWTLNSNWDVFVGLDSSTLRACTGPAWTSDSGRGSGAGTTELDDTTTPGVSLNKNSMTCRYNNTTTFTCAADRCTYLGSFRTGSAGQTNFVLGAVAAHGTAGIIGIWNNYNRLPWASFSGDSADSWAATTASWNLPDTGAGTGIKTSYILGKSRGVVQGTYFATGSTTTSSARTGVGDNVTNAFCGAVGTVGSASAATATASCKVIGTLGFRTINALEFGATGVTMFGDGGAPTSLQTGFQSEGQY